MVKDAKHFSGPHFNKKIWRYMDLPKFIDLITTSQLYFGNLSKMTDQFEGIIPERNLNRERKRLSNMEYLSNEEIEQRVVWEADRVKSFKDFTLVNCWSQNDDESYALWKIFLGGSPYGVAIRSWVRELKKAFIDDTEIFIGTVNYDNVIEGTINQDNVILRKSPFYKYEEEVRLYLKNQFITNEDGKNVPKYPSGNRIDVNLELLVNEIFISPFAPQWFKNVIENLLDGIKSDFKQRIKTSSIRDE